MRSTPRLPSVGAQAVVNPVAAISAAEAATIHRADGRDTFINFREKAPAAATADMYLDAEGQVIKNASLLGYRAVAVPERFSGASTWR